MAALPSQRRVRCCRRGWESNIVFLQEGLRGKEAEAEGVNGHGRIREMAGDCKLIISGSVVAAERLDGVCIFTKSVALKGLSWNRAFRSCQIGGDFCLFSWGEDKVVINVLEARDMDIILIANALFSFVPKRGGRSQLGLFGEEFANGITIMVLEEGKETRDHIASFGFHGWHASKDNSGLIEVEVVDSMEKRAFRIIQLWDAHNHI